MYVKHHPIDIAFLVNIIHYEKYFKCDVKFLKIIKNLVSKLKTKIVKI